MLLAADENIEKRIVTWLRERGHDVLYAAEATAGNDDDSFLARATAEKRVVITHDLDFGQLVRHQNAPAVGLVLLRFEDGPADVRLAQFVMHWPLIESQVNGNFVIISRTRTRVRALSG
jgi:predicted nuclease of predicted toxin-antitoxin system